jgi:hypothetical protein
MVVESEMTISMTEPREDEPDMPTAVKTQENRSRDSGKCEREHNEEELEFHRPGRGWVGGHGETAGSLYPWKLSDPRVSVRKEQVYLLFMTG